MNSHNLSNYKPIIGLEVHVELATKSKMFCGCPADHFGKEPNTQTCPVCLALPGALPVPNKKAIEWTILLGLALGCEINEISKFDRKNYFYPDLPKGYQISQYDEPFCVRGKLEIEKGKTIRITRVHLEEDTGKLQHRDQETLVDFNRSGVPLVEIVTEPDFHSIEEVDIYLKKLQKIIRYLGVSSADMEKGSMRLEPSISLTTDYKLPLPNYRVELKNINSFRFVRKALEYEIERQQKEEHVQQTRGWDEVKQKTFAQREKEEAHDYRYFPEPDIPPIRITKEKIESFRKEIPELPDAKLERFMTQYLLSEYQANILVEDRTVADDFEKKVRELTEFSAKDIANSIINKRPLQTKSTVVVDEKELDEVIKKVLTQNPKAVADYKAGKTQVIGFLIGTIVKEYKTPVDKQLIISNLTKLLSY